MDDMHMDSARIRKNLVVEKTLHAVHSPPLAPISQPPGCPNSPNGNHATKMYQKEIKQIKN